MLATDEDLALLHGSDHWIADGNFDFQPKGFVQLYTIHGFFFGFLAVHRNVVQSGSLEWLPDQSTFDWGPFSRQ